MKRKSVLIVSSMLVATALWPVVAGSKSPAPDEAVYQGRTAQQWLTEVFTTNQSAALAAFRAMGTNALPFWSGLLRNRNPRGTAIIETITRGCRGGIKKHLAPPGPTDRDRWNTAQLVVLNVPHGHDEIRAMLRLMADPKHPARFFVTSASGWLKPGDEDCVPVLMDCLKDTNAEIRWHAAEGLGYIGPGARAALPALTAALDEHITNTGDHKAPFDVRLEAAYAIWQIDRQTDAPASVCREQMNSRDAATRGWALVYLGAIHPNDPSLMPKIIERLRGGGVFQLVAASQIGRFGPAAKEAVPDLIKLADSNDWDLRHRARQSLKQIDPKAAAKFDQE